MQPLCESYIIVVLAAMTCPLKLNNNAVYGWDWRWGMATNDEACDQFPILWACQGHTYIGKYILSKTGSFSLSVRVRSLFVFKKVNGVKKNFNVLLTTYMHR